MKENGQRWKLDSFLPKSVWLALLLFALGSPFSLAAAESSYYLVLVLWFMTAIRCPGAYPVRGKLMLFPICTFAALKILSALRCPDPAQGLEDCIDLSLLFMIIVTASILTSVRRLRIFFGVLAISGALSGLVGLIQYLSRGQGDLFGRVSGPFGHYMTFAGILAMISAATLALVFFVRPRGLLFILSLLLTGCALACTYTRSAWLGISAAGVFVLALRRKKWLAAIPVLILLALLLLPMSLFERAISILDPENLTNRERVYMARSGYEMVRDHPVLGVGPHMVRRFYAAYRLPEAFELRKSHLHSNFLQIAAELGIPALLAWLSITALYFRQVYRVARSRSSGDQKQRPFVLASCAAVLAFHVTGLFEYNFGDSEVELLFLSMLGIPFGVRNSGQNTPS